MDEDRLRRFQDNGIFRNSDSDGMDSTPTIPLGILLSSCHLWTAQKVCNFLTTSWENMKEREDDDETNELQERLRSQSMYAIPLDEENEPNWTKVLGNHWNDILKIRYINSGDENSKSVVQLLRLIRNKLSHPPKGEKDRIALGWFPIKDLDKSAYVTYWAHKFPKLIGFLWMKLYQSIIHSQLSDYYSSLLTPTHINYMSLLQLDLDSYMKLLLDALREHLEEGGLAERFRNADEVGAVTLLEFRTLPYDGVIQTVLDGKSSVIMHIRQQCVSITWYKIDTSSAEISVNNRLEYTLQETNPFGNTLTTLVFVNTLQDRFLIEECAKSSHVIIFFSNNGIYTPAVNSIAKKLSNSLTPYPLNWTEMSVKSKSILEKGEFNFQNKSIEIKDILPQSDSGANFVILEGNCLINDLLLKRKPIVFGKHELPALSNTYIKRQLFRTCMVTSKVLRHRIQDIFIVTNIKREVLEEKAKPSEMKQMKHIEEFMSEKEDLNVRIYYTSDCDSHNLRNTVKVLYSSPEKDKSKSIHFLRYDKDDLFEWLGTFGSHSIIKESFAKIADCAFLEDRFLAKIMDEQTELIFIADKPGMGKSLLLTSLSNKISTNFNDRFVLYLQMKDVVEQVSNMNKGKSGKGQVSKINKRKYGKERISYNDKENCLNKQIKSVILDTLCTTIFERCVAEFWLQQSKATSTSIKFELMLDGLDEVNKNYKKIALDILKVIHREFSSIRLWVTLREHMIEELENHFSVIVYKILPFSKDVQIDFLKDYWTKTQFESIYSPQELHEKANNCVTGLMSKGIETEIAGAPLQCRMLAEIYEDKLDEVPDGESIHFVLTQMYEDMIEKKLRECLAEKQGWDRNQFHGNYMSVIRETMQHNHMYFAIKLLFSDKTSDLFCAPLRITSQKKEDMESTVKDEGIIQSVKPLAFIHRTFAEYFVALFIFRVLSGEILGLDANNVNFQFFFINEALDLSNSKQQLSEGKFIGKFKFPVLCYFLNAMLDDQDKTFTEMESMMTTAHDFQQGVFSSQKSVILATLQGSYFNIAKLIIGSLSGSNIDYFMNRTDDVPEFLFIASVRCTDVDFFKYICSTIEAWYESSHDDPYKIPESIFKLALHKGKYEIATFLIEMKGFGVHTWHNMRENDSKKHGIYHWIMMKSRHDEDEVLTEKKKLLQYVFDIEPILLEQKDNEEETPLFMPPSVPVALKKFLITNLGANVNAIGKYNNTPFHWIKNNSYKSCLSPEGYHEMLETFLNNGFNRINLSNQNGCTPLHCAIETYKDSLNERTLELFRNAGADFNAKNKGSTVLHFCIKNKCEDAFIFKLIKYGSDIFVKNSQGHCALQLARKKSKCLGDILTAKLGDHKIREE